MGIHLALQHDLGQPDQQAARPGQRQALGPHPLSSCRTSSRPAVSAASVFLAAVTVFLLRRPTCPPCPRNHTFEVTVPPPRRRGPRGNAAAARPVYIPAVLAPISLARGQQDVSKPGPVRKPAGAIWPAQPATDAEPHALRNRQAVATGAVMGNLSTTITESPPNR